MAEQPLYIEQRHQFPRGRFAHAVFDFDGTVSLLREGWEEVMAPFMEEVIWPGEPAPAHVREQVRAYIDTSTGVQTIVQMEHLVAMAREHGRVRETNLLDALGYKERYRERLMERVNERTLRLNRLATGKRSADDFLVRGVVDFLQRLHARGVTLHLFSGSDLEDVRNEAQLLGVVHYFSDVRGATGSFADYNKEKVLQELMAAHKLEGGQVLVVGDGPVEIKVAAAHACVALGVACDESQGECWDPAKRERLVAAGADLLVPDFSRAGVLEGYLFNE